MANRHLSKRLIDTLKPAESVRDVRGTELRAYGVRILPSGRRRTFVRAQINGQCVWTTVGDAGTMQLSEAQAFARSHLATLRNGGRPVQGRPPQRFRSGTSRRPFSADMPTLETAKP